MLFLSSLLYLAISLLVSFRVFGHVSFSKSIIVFFLVITAINTLIIQILSLVHLLDKSWLYLVIQAFICLGLGLILLDPPGKIFKVKISSFKFQFSKTRGLERYLIVLVGGILLLSLYIGSLVPINNSDSLHTHLPRIYYWIQHGSMAYWDAITETQLNYPAVLSMQGTWLFLLGGSELIFFLATWLALVTTAVLIYELSLLLGFSNQRALLAALISLSFPVLLLQTFSYQADVFAAALGLASSFFLMLFIHEKRKLYLFASLLPLALALGSKQTAFIFLPFFILVMGILYWKKHITLKDLLRSGVFLLFFFVILSSYKFIQNTLDREKLSSSMFASYRYAVPFTQQGDGRHYATNALRYIYNATSVDGLTGRLKLAAIHGREVLFKGISSGLGLNLEVKDYVAEEDNEYFEYSVLPPLNEDAAWFGPLCLVLFPVMAIVILAGKNKTRKRYLWLTTAFFIATFLLISILVTSWNPAHGRYLVLPMLMFAPLFGVLIPQKRAYSRLVTVVISITALYLAVSTLLINDSRPVVTQSTLYEFQAKHLEKWDDSGFLVSIYAKYIANRVIKDLALTSPSRRDIHHQSYYENLFYQSNMDIPDIEFINATVETTETLYLYINKSVIEYALFGLNKTRDLVPVNSLQLVPAGAWLLVDKGRTPTIINGYTLVAENKHYFIYRRP